MSKNNKIRKILSISILISTVSIGIYWWNDSKQVKWIKNDTPIITDTPSPEELAGWGTYRNQKYGYEIKYPDGFHIISPFSTQSGQFIQHKTEKSNYIGITVLEEEVQDGKFQEVRLGEWKSFISFVDDYVEELALSSFEGKRKYFSKQVTEFNNYDAVLVKYDSFPELNRIFIYYNKKVYLIISLASSEYENIINQILSTFKFVSYGS